LFLPRGRTLPLPLLNLIRFLSAQLSSLPRARWMAAQPAGVSTTAPSLVSPANLLPGFQGVLATAAGCPRSWTLPVCRSPLAWPARPAHDVDAEWGFGLGWRGVKGRRGGSAPHAGPVGANGSSGGTRKQNRAARCRRSGKTSGAGLQTASGELPLEIPVHNRVLAARGGKRNLGRRPALPVTLLPVRSL